MKIGFDNSSHTFYEGFPTLRGALPLSSSITFSQATFITNSENGIDDVLDEVGPNEYKVLFREDSFDPITKIRRGRFYQPDMSEAFPSSILVASKPGLEAYSSMQSQSFGRNKELRIFKSMKVKESFSKPSMWPLVVIGWRSSPTFWRILQIENISTGEELVYLRARNSIGILPELDFSKNEEMSLEDRTEINRKLDSLSNDLHTSTAQSIVDHCRDLAEVLLRAKIRQKDKNFKGQELNELVEKFQEYYSNEFRLVSHYSQIIRQFHQRRKTAIQDEKKVRFIREEDAELTVHCISSMIRDLGIGEHVYS